jgi:DNA replication protein DnaC
MMTHPLQAKLRQLKLYGMLQTLELRAEQAARQLTPLEFFALLLDDELERRGQARLVRRLAYSGCDGTKSLTQFDFSAAPGINRTLIQDLSTCAFLPRHENILICGPSGVGKSHLANGPLRRSNATSASWPVRRTACWPICMPLAPMATQPLICPPAQL